MSITWLKRDDSHCESECGKYSVSRALMFDRDPAGALRYTAWRRGSESPMQLGECADDFKSAAALCERDAAEDYSRV